MGGNLGGGLLGDGGGDFGALSANSISTGGTGQAGDIGSTTGWYKNGYFGGTVFAQQVNSGGQLILDFSSTLSIKKATAQIAYFTNNAFVGATGLDLGLVTEPFTDLFLKPSSTITPTVIGGLTIEATSNTTLTFKLKGSDSTVRTGTITLS